MLDFVKIRTTEKKTNEITVWSDFINYATKDLMARGGGFYAVWDEDVNLWSTNGYRVKELIDREILAECDRIREKRPEANVKPLLLKYDSTGQTKKWISYTKGLPDNFMPLDENVIFANTATGREDYASHKLPYDLVEGKCEAYEEIMSTLYDPSEREKLEWAIGSIIQGDSKTIQKFIVLYGDKGTGKSTVLNIYQEVLDGYWSAFTAKDLARSNADFALESFKSNPLMAIQHDGDLSRIEDNTKLNSIISHEPIEINEKHKGKYMMKLNSFLFMGTNHPVKITDSKSGILRRLIDVSPSGRTLPTRRYDELMGKIKFELGPIAYHCLQVYKELGRNFYNKYTPMSMMSSTNDFFNFVEDSFFVFKDGSADGVSLSFAWKKYNEYSTEAKIPYSMSKMRFKDELKNYFDEFYERKGNRVNVYYGFKESIFAFDSGKEDKETKQDEGEEKAIEGGDGVNGYGWIVFDGDGSYFDENYQDIPAQYCKLNDSGKPIPEKGWDYVTTRLKDLDTSIVHFCRPGSDFIDMDFDCKDENGNKSLKKCLEAAVTFPETYAEVSQGGEGLHLYYIYDGDANELDSHYAKDIEIKIHTGKRPLRRRLSKYNSLPIAHIYSGLPKRKKKEAGMVSAAIFEGEQKLRSVIAKGLRKEGNPDGSTSSNVDFINKVLEQAYDSGQHYDVRDMKSAVQDLAQSASNQALRCCKVVSNMKFCSKDVEMAEKEGSYILDEYCGDDSCDDDEDKPIVIYDVESFENLFLIGYKPYDPPGYEGEHPPQVMMFPAPEECKRFFLTNRLVGFNNKNYDDAMLYSAADGYSVKELYNLSQRIIAGTAKKYTRDISYADIYDFSSEKKSLKKFEIDLGVHHQEVGIPWDEPVPEELFGKVAEYCMNDVMATEALWNSKDRQKDWRARQILSEISGLPVGESNNSHSKAIMFEGNRSPQSEFNYTDLSIEFPGYEFNEYGIDKERYIKNEKGKPICTTGKSIYMQEDPSEGGYAWGKPGMYGCVKAFDVASMHPSTMIALKLFGDRYTERLKELVDLRKAIKRGQFELAGKLFDGRLVPYLDDPSSAKGVADALKIVINSIYGLTAAHFDNPFRDPRNVDNIVAKRGALFMIRLKHLVQDKGYEVVHCKTDCIKVADADDAISEFIVEEGKKYGYEFEVEHWFDKFCILNKATYIGRLRDEEGNLGEWIAVADQFKEPYVFKTLFSGEPIEFSDLCQTKSVKSAIYLDMNEEIGPLSEDLKKEMDKLEKKIKKGEASQFDIERFDELSKEEAGHHNYIFVGKVGSFCPIEPGYGGGELVRDQDGKMYAVEGTSGYRWLEAEVVKGTDLENHINMEYYERLARDAVIDISKWGDFEWFISDRKYDGTMLIPMTATKALHELDKELINPPESSE